ncbi:hypothetical protein DAT35_27825 [Vitiosangium sp. GDMCC 1.1324]|nr:hypothetical protein DAT35_27825 [Vitiosangium sp. GDMCC 1.1324]
MPPYLVQGRLVELDGFEALLRRAGLEDSRQLLSRTADFTPEDAAELYEELLGRPVTLARFGPRLVASTLLREVMEGEEELPRPALLARVARFEGLAVLRPDGYVAWALSGRTQQRVGAVALKDGALRAGPFEVGVFYDGRSGAFFPVDERLERVRSRPPLAEVYDDGDVINRSLDGAEDVFRDTVLALGGLVFHPADSLAALSRMPRGVAELVLHSPEYLERFRLMLEAKGPGYANKFTDRLEPKPWFTRGARNIVDQAQRQFRAARGAPIRWHVAEARAADAIRKMLDDAGLHGIEVIHTPALP